MDIGRIAALRRTVLFGCLPEKELAVVAAHVAEMHFRQGEMLFFSGEEAKGLFVVVMGKVRVFQHSAGGREMVMHVDTDGAVIAEVPTFDDGPYPASAVAESDVEALFLAKRDMLAFCGQYPSLAFMALRLMAQRVRRHAQLVEALSFHEVGQRLALFLLAEAKRANSGAGSPIEFRLMLSNQEVANRIGSVRDVVSRAFARLKHDGLIVAKGRTVIVPDLRALELYAASAGTAGASIRRLA